MSKKLIAIVIVAVLLVSAVGTALLLFSGSGKSKYDANVFRFGSAGSHDGLDLDPAVNYETVGGEILQNVYETLVWYNSSSSDDLVPMLATKVPTVENGGMSEDGLTYIFTIREGVKFSDNSALAAADVKYSFDRGLMLNYGDGPFFMYGKILIPDYDNYGAANFSASGEITPGIPQSVLDQHIWASDEYTVQFNLTKAYPAFLKALAFNGASIVSKAYVEANGGVNRAGYDHMRANTMGTGPYMIAEIKSDDYVKLVRNPHYWREPAAIGTVLIQQYPDANTRIMALKNGDLDAAHVPRAMRASVEGVEGIMVVKGNLTFNIDFLGLNQKLNVTDANPAVTNVPSDFFTDKNVRLAFAHAFNYALYINETLQGMAVQPNGAIPMGMFAYDESVPIFEYDLEKAKEYLQAALVGDSGESWYDKGFNLELIYNEESFARKTACMLLKAGLEELSDDIKITVTSLAWPTYWDIRTDGKLPAFLLGFAPDYADPDNYVKTFYHSGGTYSATVGYKNATLDAMIDKAASELDEDVRAEMYRQIMMDMYGECIYIWTAHVTNFFVGRDYIEGYTFNPMYSNLYYYDLSKKAET